MLAERLVVGRAQTAWAAPLVSSDWASLPFFLVALCVGTTGGKRLDVIFYIPPAKTLSPLPVPVLVQPLQPRALPKARGGQAQAIGHVEVVQWQLQLAVLIYTPLSEADSLTDVLHRTGCAAVVAGQR
jgi:hypothetical protein